MKPTHRANSMQTGPDHSDAGVIVDGVYECASGKARKLQARSGDAYRESGMQQNAFGAKVQTWKSSGARTPGSKQTISIVIRAQAATSATDCGSITI